MSKKQSDDFSIDDLLKEIDQTIYEHPKESTREIPFQIRGTGLVGDVTLFNVGFQKEYYTSEKQGKDAFSSTHVPFPKRLEPSEFMKQTYLTPKLENAQEDYRIFPRLFKPNELYSLAVSKPKYVIETVKDAFTGKIKECTEVFRPQANDTSKSSTSLLRQPAASKDFVRGSSKNVPFHFGGIDRDEERGIEQVLEEEVEVIHEPTIVNIFDRPIEEELKLLIQQDLERDNSTVVEGLETRPPGFKQG